MLSDDHFLRVADIVATAGTCSRLQVGAVLVYARRIISTGYNGAPAGMPHCEHYPTDLSDGCRVAVHAEVNAVAFAAKNGVATDGSVMYTTDSPCVACAQLLINAGIKEVIYSREYRNTEGIKLLERAGIPTVGPMRPELSAMFDPRGNDAGLHSSQPSDPSFDEGWTKYSESHRGGGSRL